MARFIKYQSSKSFLTPDKATLDGIEEAIRWAEAEVPALLMTKMNELVFYMALVNQGFARKMSFGPFDPQQRNPGSAWQLPVRRISGNYYMSWKVRQVRPAVWQLYNDSREAYYIEFGINWRGNGRRVRRPVRKLTLRQTMNFMMTTKAYHRIWVDIYANPKHRHRGRGFTQIVQSPGGRWVDMSDREISSVVRGADRGAARSFRIRSGPKGRMQRWRGNARDSGTYEGKHRGRRLP